MSDGTNNVAQAPPQIRPASPNAVFGFLRDNFALVSGLAVAGGVGLATIFLYSYLGMFAWHLIFFVQYADILTCGLIAVGIICGSYIFLQAVVQTFLDISRFRRQSKWPWLIVSGLALLALIAFFVNDAIRQGEGYFHVLFGAMTLALGVMLILTAVDFAGADRWPNVSQVAFAMVLIIISTVSLGGWLAYSVLETSGYDKDVILKDGTLSGVKLIIVMSRHTILQKDKIIYVVPTADVAQFRSTGRR